MSNLAAFATFVMDNGGQGMELDRRTRWSPVALRVWLPDNESKAAAAKEAHHLGLYVAGSAKVNPFATESSWQLVIELTDSQVAEAMDFLARRELDLTKPELPASVRSTATIKEIKP